MLQWKMPIWPTTVHQWMSFAQTNGAANRQAVHTQTNGQAIDADANIQTNNHSNSSADIQTDNSQTMLAFWFLFVGVSFVRLLFVMVVF
jgi:hypothetical protein